MMGSEQQSLMLSEETDGHPPNTPLDRSDSDKPATLCYDFTRWVRNGRLDTDAFRTKGKHRSYRWPITGEAVPSVTAVLGRVFDKDWLARWKMNCVLDWVRNNPAQADKARKTPDDEWPTVRKLMVNQSEDRTASEFGSLVHEILERTVLGESMKALVDKPDYREAASLSDRVLSRLSTLRLSPILVEAPVFRLGTDWIPDRLPQGYAGTADLMVQVEEGSPFWESALPDGGKVRAIADLKTGKRLGPSFPLQLAAYARAEWYVAPSGYCHAMPAIQSGLVIHAPRSEEVSVVPVDLEQSWELWKQALLWDACQSATDGLYGQAF